MQTRRLARGLLNGRLATSSGASAQSLCSAEGSGEHAYGHLRVRGLKVTKAISMPPVSQPAVAFLVSKAVPEPGTAVLVLVGALSAIVRRHKVHYEAATRRSRLVGAT
ncbi:MAG: PEP-CTERM sorting domain-containing protein [Chthonomonadaceae bacterium]|nr:PEP-CTERM sorting domain-containing protein [Chthonomonadaceae bacterium]